MKKLYTSTDDIQGDKSMRIVRLFIIHNCNNYTRETFFFFVAVLSIRFFKDLVDSGDSIMVDVVTKTGWFRALKALL